MTKLEELDVKITEFTETASKEELQNVMKLIEDYLGKSKEEILDKSTTRLGN